MISAVLALVAPALAQDVPNVAVDGQLYRPPIDARGTLWADDSAVTPGLGAKVGAGYVHEPVVWVWEDTGERVPLVADAVGLNVIGSYAFWRIRGAVDVPVYVYANGNDGSGPGLGDLGIDIKGMILDAKEMPVGLGLTFRTDIPVISSDVPLAANGVGWEAAIVVDQNFGPVLVAANLGTRGQPAVTIDNVSLENQLAWRLGAGFSPADQWGLSLDFAGYAEWSDLGNTAGAPAEALVGGWFRVGDQLKVQAGAGHGLSRGIGASSGRAVLALAYEPPSKTSPQPKPVATQKPVAPAAPKPASTQSPPPTPAVIAPAVVAPPVVAAPVVAPVVAAPVATAKEPVVVSKNKLLLYQRIAFDGASLRADGAQQLDAIVRYLANHPEIEMIRIEGHTDGRGDASDELALSGTRAGIVLEYLTKKGLEGTRFYAAGYGGMRPVAVATDESSRVANERVEFVVTKWAEGYEPQ